MTWTRRSAKLTSATNAAKLLRGSWRRVWPRAMAAARLTDVARMTLEKLLRDLGAASMAYQDEHLRNLTCRRVQCDEIWAFCYARKKNVTPEIAKKHPDAGDVWTWTAIDRAASWSGVP